jgi:hypothetical protein
VDKIGIFMDRIEIWVSIISFIIFPALGYFFKVTIMNKMDEIIRKQDEDRGLFFRKYDEQKDTFVRRDMYEQARMFHKSETDEKFNHIMEKIDDLREMILKNFNQT